ncbi:hypothetical protein E4U13_003837 [Claviceps humidiphila]|uniref:Uncharacterized protein n=1 Tax=Claviceps humidiphila TaxID=1294629 RepID=A0A9P7Q8U1_9HYPO|nr:hypothetical protein E4U13_003837 [Claviceps humidiphila]
MVVKSSSSQLLVRWLRARPPRRSVEATPSFPVVRTPGKVALSLRHGTGKPLDRSTSDVGPSHQSVMSDVIAFGRQLTLDALGTNLRSLPLQLPVSRVGIIPDHRWPWQAHCQFVIGAAWSDGFTVTMGYHRGGISFQRTCLPPIRTLTD